MLAPDLLDRVLERLGFSGRPSADREGLAQLYLAWCERVPFDNVQKRLALARGESGALPGLAPEAFFETWLRHGVGATCWPAAGALHALCVTLGFEAERAIATMVRNPQTRPTHGTVIVALDGESLMLDVALLTRVPLPLVPGDEPLVDHPAAKLRRVRDEDGRFAVHWQPFHLSGTLPCRIESVGASALDFAEAYERSRAWSPFNYSISARITRADGVFGLGLGRRASLTAAGLTVGEPLTPNERTRLLVDELGMSEELVGQLPADEALPPPPGG